MNIHTKAIQSGDRIFTATKKVLGFARADVIRAGLLEKESASKTPKRHTKAIQSGDRKKQGAHIPVTTPIFTRRGKRTA